MQSNIFFPSTNLIQPITNLYQLNTFEHGLEYEEWNRSQTTSGLKKKWLTIANAAGDKNLDYWMPHMAAPLMFQARTRIIFSNWHHYDYQWDLWNQQKISDFKKFQKAQTSKFITLRWIRAGIHSISGKTLFYTKMYTFIK
jgi:hypothetical protein